MIVGRFADHPDERQLRAADGTSVSRLGHTLPAGWGATALFGGAGDLAYPGDGAVTLLEHSAVDGSYASRTLAVPPGAHDFAITLAAGPADDGVNPTRRLLYTSAAGVPEQIEYSHAG